MQQHTKPWEAVMIAGVVAVWVGLGVTPAVAKRALVEVTGQTQCWDVDGAPIAECSTAGAGQDGAIQAGVKWSDTRFTGLGNGTVQDTLTTLIWLKDAGCLGSRTWAEALAAVATLNAGMIACWEYTGTFADWRLPNVKELQSLIDFSHTGPALPNGHPFVDVRSAFYWSSTTRARSPEDAWAVSLRVGITHTDTLEASVATDTKKEPRRVWAVRGGIGSPSMP